ncbi:hypothetical protein BP00DRAFT_455472 [Aspergillus indologenus CBS 114.80]|uniref:Uncharacterized protein n=1 Tax=Aspergillus indologenus CBS 114.80 TaxID=1450541 RepID=A0A2V5IAB5_9EURO|nr:hypothetical protein BP00DRAFT_455472 [Aspergillus indologenus CBS 114.80]
MAPAPYFQSLVTESAFNARFRSENGQIFSDLDEVSANFWGRSHLLACRVVRREPQRNVLPVLLPHIESSDIQSPSDEIKAFLHGPDSALMAQSEHYLVRSSNCSLSVAQIWAAMATFKGPLDRRGRGTNVLDEPNEHMQDSETDLETRGPKRLRRLTSQQHFINPTQIQFGSSSPVRSDSYHGSQPSSVGYVDQDTHSLARVPYMDDLESPSPEHMLYISSTPWFDLDRRSGRESVLANLCGIMRRAKLV